MYSTIAHTLLAHVIAWIAMMALVCCLIVVAHIVHASLLCDVTHYGAIGDGKTQNVAAFRSAIDACASGGVVRVPSPGIFLAAPFNLSSHQILEVQRGATLLGTTNISLVPLMQPFPSMGGDITRDGHPCRYAPLVGAFNETNVSVTGGGLIDGNGAWWWDQRSKMNVEPPRLLEAQYVDGLSLTDIALTNSPFWTVHPYACRNVVAQRVNITASGKGQYSKNTDGIDPDSCENVLIEDFNYCAGDDAVAIKSGWNWAGQHFGRASRNITVRRVNSGCRGGFTIGSEMSGGVEDVVFQDCHSTGESGIRISSELGRGGYVRNVRFERIEFSWQKVEGKTFLLHVNQDYKPDNPNTTLSYFSNITFTNLTVATPAKDFPLGDITCLEQTPCHGFRLDGIRLAKGTKSPQALSCTNLAPDVVVVNSDDAVAEHCRGGSGDDCNGSNCPPIGLATCNPKDPAQHWQFNGHDIRSLAPILAKNTTCLDMKKESPYPVSLYPCHTGKNGALLILGDDQWWGFSGGHNTSGSIHMLGTKGNLCLDAQVSWQESTRKVSSDHVKDSSPQIFASECETGKSSQLWALDEDTGVLRNGGNDSSNCLSVLPANHDSNT